MRRKKKEEPWVYQPATPLYPDYSDIDLSPYTIEITGLSDSRRNFITTTYPGTEVTYTGSTGDTRAIYYPPTHLESNSVPLSYEEMMKISGKKEELKVKIDRIQSFKPEEHIMACQNKDDLTQDNILVTLSAIKGKLMFDIMPIHIKEIVCNMTPQVKTNLINAGKRLRMFGKKSPIIPSFDEYGNRLQDKIEIGNDDGITINIIDPKEYGELYIELKAIEFSSNTYKTDYHWPFEEDLPF